jgi:hypothetical protein
MADATWYTALLATPFASSLIPLTLRLIPLITEIAREVQRFRTAELTPQATYHFENRLDHLLRQVGREIVGWVYNHLEPDDPDRIPIHLHCDGDWSRRRKKTPNRQVATLFGAITLRRFLYQPIHGVERSIFPLEIRLGIEADHATPALAERVADAASRCPQNAVLALLRRDHGLRWSVATLRRVTATLSTGMAPAHHAASVARVLMWLEQARISKGTRKPVLAVGRDGAFVPIRDQDSYREAATATVSVYDRAGQRLGTIYLGRMPEPGQGTLSGQLTALITDVLKSWSGPLPRLAYITDAGHHQTAYYEAVLKPMEHPNGSGERLEGEWVVDYWHACQYIHRMAEELFGATREGHAWARKMCRWLKGKPHGAFRVLHSAAALRKRRGLQGSRKKFQEAYDYLSRRLRSLNYRRYRQCHLPIGSGVTEAACKTVFTQRMKQAGMTWSIEGGQVIVDLRVIQLSGVWSQAHQSYLQSKILPVMRTRQDSARKQPGKAA